MWYVSCIILVYLLSNFGEDHGLRDSYYIMLEKINWNDGKRLHAEHADISLLKSNTSAPFYFLFGRLLNTTSIFFKRRIYHNIIYNQYKYNDTRENINRSVKNYIDKYNQTIKKHLPQYLHTKEYCLLKNSKIKRTLRRYGFLDVNVQSVISTKFDKACITHNINHGLPYTISSIKYKIYNSSIEKILNNSMPLVKPGDRLLFNKLTDERDRIYDYIVNHGFATFKRQSIQFYINPNKKTNTVKVSINILDDPNNPAKRLNYGTIIVSYRTERTKRLKKKIVNYDDVIYHYSNYFTYDRIINRLIPYKTNELYSKSRENELLKSLYSTGVFKNTQIINSVVGNKINSEINLECEDRVTFSFKPTVGENDEGTFVKAVGNVTVRNLLRILERWDTDIGLESIFFTNKFELKYPRIVFDTNLSYPMSFLFSKRNVIGTKINCSFYMNPIIRNDVKSEESIKKQMFSLSPEYSIQGKGYNISVKPFSVKYFQEHKTNKRFLFIAPAFSMSNTSNKVAVSRVSTLSYSNFIEVGVELHQGRSTVFVKPTFDVALHSKIATSFIDSHIKIGIIGNILNTNILHEDVFFHVGGHKTLRGWQLKKIGSSNAKRGKLLMLANLEYRRKISSIFEVASFIDVGNVWYDGTNDTHISDIVTKLASDIGVGLRISFVGNIVVRIDCGFPIYDPLEKSWFNFQHCLHVTVGYPF